MNSRPSCRAKKQPPWRNRQSFSRNLSPRETDAGRFSPDFKPISRKKALLHGHCHQKAFAAMGAVEKTLRLIPELEVETVASSCCGMAGAFGYQEETYDISLQMAEASLLPAVRMNLTIVISLPMEPAAATKSRTGRTAMPYTWPAFSTKLWRRDREPADERYCRPGLRNHQPTQMSVSRLHCMPILSNEFAGS